MPLRVEDERKDQSGDSSDRGLCQLENRRRDLDVEFRGDGGLAGQVTRTESGAVSSRQAKIDPQVQKCDDESRTKQLPSQGQECPEDAGVAELLHPEPLLYQAGDDGQEGNEDDRYKNEEFQ